MEKHLDKLVYYGSSNSSHAGNAIKQLKQVSELVSIKYGSTAGKQE